MANVLAMLESKWLKAEDLKGRTITVTIEHAGIENIRQADGTSEDRCVVSFVGGRKRLICNKSQLAAFVRACGGDTDDWSGLQVMLSPTSTPQGKITIAVLPVPGQDDDPDKPF